MAQYNDKQLVIGKGDDRLMEEGVDLRDLKAADIAEAAGIGKGTAVSLFLLQGGYHPAGAAPSAGRAGGADGPPGGGEGAVPGEMPCDPPFLPRCVRGGRLRLPAGEKAIGSLEPSRILEEGKAFLQQRERDIARALLEVARCGKEEGVIAPPEDAAYTLLVFNSVIQGVYHAGCSGAYADGEKLEEDAYTLLVRALNESGNKNGIE